MEPRSTRHGIDFPKNKAFFSNKTLHINSFSYSKIRSVSIFSCQEFSVDEETSKGPITSQTNPPTGSPRVPFQMQAKFFGELFMWLNYSQYRKKII